METSQRAVKETATSDEKQMSELLSVATILFNLLNTTDSVTDAIDLLIQEHKIVDLISTNIIEEDIDYLEDNAENVMDSARFWLYLSDWIGRQALYYAESMLQIENYNESKVLRYFKACEATNDTLVTLTDDGPLNVADKGPRSTTETTTVVPTSANTMNGNNLTKNGNLCNESYQDHFNDTLWQQFIILINSSQIEDDLFPKIQNAWSELPFLLKTYLGLQNLDNLKQKTELVFNINMNVTEIFELLCNESMVTTTEVMVTEVTKFIPTVPVISATLPSDVINCTAIFDEVKENYFSISLYYFERELPNLFSFKDKYLSYVEKIYKNMSQILEVIPQHLKCINIIQYLENMTEELNNLYDLMVTTSNVESVEEAIPVLIQLHESYLLWKIMNDNFTAYASKVDSYDYCEWTYRAVSDERDEIRKEFDTIEGAADYKAQAILYLAAAFEAYALIESTYTMKILPTLKHFNSYLKGDMTKRELAINFNKPVFTKVLSDLEDASSEMTSYIKDFKNDVATLTLKVTEGFEELTKFTLPIFSKVNALELSFIKAVKDLKRKDFEQMIESFDDNFKKSFGELLRINYEDFVFYTEEAVNTISDTVEELTSRITSLQSDLSDYKTSTNMDVDFYM